MMRIETLHDAGSALAWLASANAQAAVLIVVVLAVRAALGRRLTPGWRGALWLLIALRLLVPLAVESRYSLAALGRSVASTRAAAPAAPPLAVATAAPRVSVTYAPIPGTDRVAAAPPVVTPRPAPAAAAIALWLAGVALLLARDLLAAASLRRAIRRMRAVDDAATLALLARCAADVGVRWRVRLVETDRLRAPAVCGIVRPVILLPAGATRTFAPGELRLVLMHELVHVRRDDALVAALYRFVVALHWFNPLVWLAAAAFRADRELACDAAVLSRLDDARDRRAYGDCVIRVVAHVNGLRPHAASLGLFGTARSLRRRVEMIADLTDRAPTSRRAARLMIGAATCAVVGCAVVAGESGTTPGDRSTTRAAAVPSGALPAPDVAARGDLDADEVLLDRRAHSPRGTGTLRLTDAIDELGRSAGVSIRTDWRAVTAAGVDDQFPVGIEVGDPPLRIALARVLSLLPAKAMLDFDVINGEVVISTADEIVRRTIVTRVYDIRDLLVLIPDFPLPRAGEAPKVTSPGASTQPFVSHEETPQATREQLVGQVMQLVTDTIDSSTWKFNGGLFGAIQELGGQLVVTQTRRNHVAIRQLLELLRGGRAIQVSVEARVVSIDPALVPTALGQTADEAKRGETTSALLSDAQARDFMEQIQLGEKAKTLTAPRLTLFNGQIAHVKVAMPTGYLANYTMTQSAAGERRFEAQTAEAESGIALEVQATISADRRHVVLTLGPTITRLVRLDDAPFAGDPRAGLSVQKPVLDTQALRTTVSVPDRGTLLLSAGQITAEAVDAGKGTAPRQVLLLVKPTIIEPLRAPAKD